MQRLARLLRYDYPELMPLWVNVFIDVLGFSILIPFLPFFSTQFNAPAWQIGLLLSTNALFGFFSGPVWGTLSDRFGRKPILLVCQFGTLAGFVMLAFSNSMWMLYASRIVDGIFGGNMPVAKAIIGDVIPPHERSKHMTNIGVAYVLSSLLGPGIGGMLAKWGILAPGLLSASLTCLAILLTSVYIVESNPALRDGAPQQAAANPNHPRKKENVIKKYPATRYLLTQWGFHNLAFMLFSSCISLFAFLRLGLDAQQVGLMLTLAGIVRLLVRFLIFVPLLRRLGDHRTLMLGLTTFVVTYILLCFVRTPFQFAAILCLHSFGASCTRGIMNSFMSRSVQPAEQGQMMGLSTSMDNFSQIVGPLAGGVILDTLPLWAYGGLAGVLAFIPFLMVLRPMEIYQSAPLPKNSLQPRSYGD